MKKYSKLFTSAYALLDSKNQTLILKVLTIMKEKKFLKPSHKELAMQKISCPDIKNVVDVL